MRFSKIKIAALAAVLSVAPLSGAMCADTTPPSPDTAPGRGAKSGAVISWMESIELSIDETYDWLTQQFKEGNDGIGYIVYDGFEDAVDSLMYFFNTFLPDNGFAFKAEKKVLDTGILVKATNNTTGETYKYLTTPTLEGRGINFVETDINSKQPTFPARNVPVLIDGGASLLLVACAAYGIKRFRKNSSV